MGWRAGRRWRIGLAGLLVVALGLAGAGLAWHRARLAGELAQGERALAAREPETALRHLEAYLAARPGDPHARLLAARAARAAGQRDKAEEHLRAARPAGANGAALDLEWALLALGRGEAGVVPALRARAALDDDLALTALEAVIQHDLDAYALPLALEGLNRYLARRPGDLAARLGRAFVWERFLYFADALADYRAALAAHPDSEVARFRLAKTLLLVGTPGEALDHYAALAETHPTRRDVRLGLARCHRHLGDYDSARPLLDALLSKDPAHAEALTERGVLALGEGDLVAAERWLRQALAAAPHDRTACYNLTQCLLQQRRPAEAQDLAAQGARIEADLRRIDELSKRVMRRPHDAEARAEAGVLFVRNGQEAEGVRWLQRALRLDPNCRVAREALASLGRRPAPTASARTP